MTRRLWLAIPTVVALCCALSACQRNGGVAPAANPAQQNAPPTLAATVFTGTASCSGRSCHGGLEARADQTSIGQNEYSKWLTDDVHANAFQVLLQPRSKDSPDPKAIAAKLNIKEPHKSALCLNCHMTPYASADASDSKLASGSAYQKSLAMSETMFGVGCESCHGRAEKWISDHTGEKWTKLNEEQKSAQGFVAFRNVKELSKTCVGCHVGAPPAKGEKDHLPLARDVNHDLIAAGHPRLNFELDVFLENMPPHWNVQAKEKRDGKDVHARLWTQGQLASAQAALELLEFRANEVNARPWPEFAEYDCFACHHDLQGDEPGKKHWRRRDPGGRRLGALAWGTWHFSTSRLLGDKILQKQLHDMEEFMGRPAPPRQQVIKLANETAGSFRELSIRMDKAVDRPRTKQWLLGLGSDDRWQNDPSWDAAMQIALAAHSLNQSYGDDLVKKALKTDLAFGPGYDSPHHFTPENIKQLREALLKVKD